MVILTVAAVRSAVGALVAISVTFADTVAARAVTSLAEAESDSVAAVRGACIISLFTKERDMVVDAAMGGALITAGCGIVAAIIAKSVAVF